MPEALGAVERWPTGKAKSWTARFLREAASGDDIVAVVAIGSAVRKNVPSVDLDLLVVQKSEPRLAVKAPLEIDVRSYAAGQIEPEIAAGNDLLGWAVRYGRPLYERDGYWSCVLAKWQDKLPLPNPAVAERRSADAYRRLKGLMDAGDVAAAREQAISYATHRARAELIRRGVYPASRPELPEQLRTTGQDKLASLLEQLIGGTHTRKILELLKDEPFPPARAA
ncbi:MAG: hypothetical protein ACT4P4_03325 [Betaproteobacteria bacterium]